MKKPTYRTLAAPLGIALVVMLALPLAALANTSEAIAQTGGMTLILPMPGTALKVDVKLDAVGNISAVDLDPVGTYLATKRGPHAVTVESGDGTSQVKINAKGDKLAVKASFATLASLLGTGTWSADLFGTHAPTSVPYTIGDVGGEPTLALGAITGGPSDMVVTPGTPEMKSGPKGSEAKVKIEFTRDGFTKKLEIKVSVKGHGDRPATLKITLSGKDKQKLTGTLAELIALGTRTWSGHLCDGTPVSFTYSVQAPGMVVYGNDATPPATVKTHEDGDEHGDESGIESGFDVRFDGTKTKVKVRLEQEEDGSWELKVDAKADKCKHTPANDPTVNAPDGPNVHLGHGHHGDPAKSDHTDGNKADHTDGVKADGNKKGHRG